MDFWKRCPWDVIISIVKISVSLTTHQTSLCWMDFVLTQKKLSSFEDQKLKGEMAGELFQSFWDVFSFSTYPFRDVSVSTSFSNNSFSVFKILCFVCKNQRHATKIRRSLRVKCWEFKHLIVSQRSLQHVISSTNPRTRPLHPWRYRHAHLSCLCLSWVIDILVSDHPWDPFPHRFTKVDEDPNFVQESILRYLEILMLHYHKCRRKCHEHACACTYH